MPRSKTKLVRHDYSLATEMASRGCTEGTIAKALSISPRTLRTLKAEDERLASAIDIGKAILADEMVGILVEKARNGDRRAAESVLNRLIGPVEKDAAPVAAVGIRITLPDSMSREEWDKIVDVAALPEPNPERGDE